MYQRGQIGVIILVALVVLVAGGAGAWYYYNQQQLALTTPIPTVVPGLPTSSPVTSVAASNFSGKLTDLVRQGQNVTCTFQRADQAGAVNGTLYVSGQGQKMRGDFTIQQASAGAIASHMIRDGQTMYVWSDQLPQGTKLTTTEELTVSASPSPTAGSSSEQLLDQNFQYSCQPWTVSETVFVLPTNVQFVDITQQLPQFQGTGAPATSPQ